MARKSKDKAYVANYPELKAWLDKYEMHCNWQLPCGGDPEDPRAYVESYSAPGKRECIVVVRSDRIGWELYTPTASTKIDETLADAVHFAESVPRIFTPHKCIIYTWDGRYLRKHQTPETAADAIRVLKNRHEALARA